MSAPRRLLPGATYLVTRRCTQRQFLLRPGLLTNQIFLYCLAIAAERTKVELHAFVVMSNHWHAVLTDPEARVPEFLQLLHRLVASCMNAFLGRTENFWASGHTSLVTLESADDVLDKIAYVMANPTAAGLVASPGEWPGVITRRLGESHVVARPKVYFSDCGAMPDVARIECTVPRALREDDREVLAGRLRSIVGHSVRRARQTILAAGRTFLGAKRVTSTPTLSRPSTREPLRARRPTLAAKDPVAREAASTRLRAFRRAYWNALARWQAGDRSARFPEGTYLMRVLHSARCGPGP